MKIRDIIEEVTPEQMERRQYDDGYDAGAVDIRMGVPNRFRGRMPRTIFERGYLAGYRTLKVKKTNQDDTVHDDVIPAAA